MAVDRSILAAKVNDSGNNTDGSLVDKAFLDQVVNDVVDARWSEASTTSTGSQNNLSFSEADTIRANNASTLTLTGLTAPASPAKPAKRLILVAIGAGTVVLNNEDATSTAANRIITGTGAALTLAASTGWAALVYDDTSDRWRVLGSSAAAGGAPSVTTSTLTGAQNNWAPTLGTQTLIEWSGAADAAFTGLAGGTAGKIVTIKNTGTKVATFAHQSASSSAGNKFTNTATSAPTPIAAGGWIIYQYDGTDWQMVGHEQGAWITATFAAGNFTAAGSMTWTVDAGDVASLAYRLSGRTVTVVFQLETTTIGGTVNATTIIGSGAIGSFTIARTTWAIGFVINNGATGIAALVQAGYGASGIGLFVSMTGSTNYVAGTNNNSHRGTISYDVT